MKTSVFSLAFAFLASFQVASVNAQNPTRNVPPSYQSGPCLAQVPIGGGWNIRVNYQDPAIFDEGRDLAGAPFTTSTSGQAYLNTTRYAYYKQSPVFTCNQTALTLTTFYFNSTSLQWTMSAWIIPFDGSGVQPANLGALPGETFIAARMASQGNRSVMFADYRNAEGAVASRIVDISSDKPQIVYDFGFDGLKSASVAQTCATTGSVLFSVQLGKLIQLFRANKNGVAYLPTTPGMGVSLSCAGNVATVTVGGTDNSVPDPPIGPGQPQQ